MEKARRNETYVEHALPSGGHELPGRAAGTGDCRAFLVARIRWPALLRDLAYGEVLRAAPLSVEELGLNAQALLLNHPLAADSVWDLDVFISYGVPYWPRVGDTTGDPFLGPLGPVSAAGLYLTAVSTQRSLEQSPTPEIPYSLPVAGQTPNRLTGGRPDPNGDIYWWINTVTARENLVQTS